MSGSVTLNVVTVVPVAWFSWKFIDVGEIAVGGSFTSVTKIVKIPVYVNPPESVVLTLIEYEFLTS